MGSVVRLHHRDKEIRFMEFVISVVPLNHLMKEIPFKIFVESMILL